MKYFCQPCIESSPVIAPFWHHPGFPHGPATCGMCGKETECVVIPIGQPNETKGSMPAGEAIATFNAHMKDCVQCNKPPTDPDCGLCEPGFELFQAAMRDPDFDPSNGF